MTFTNKNKYNPDANGKLSDLLSLGEWKKGIINRVDELSMPNDALVDALNVDIDVFGNVMSREGYTRLLEANCHSIFSFGKHVYFVKDKNLVRMNKDEVVENLITNFTLEKVSYVEVAGELYLSSNNRTVKINKLGNTDIWGVKSPYQECEVSVGSAGSGSLKKGSYRINYSYVTADGYETGIYPLDTEFQVDYDNFNLEVSCTPSSQSESANFYISMVNGSELYLAKAGASQDNKYEVEIDYFDRLSKSPKVISEEMPVLDNLCFANGRIWGTKKDKILFSNDRDYKQYNPVLYLGIDGTDIVIFKAVDSGLYVVTELGTYFMTVKNPEDMDGVALNKICDYSAIKGTLFQQDDKSIGWLSAEGYMVGDLNGKLENKTRDKIDFSKNYKDGATLVMKRNGVHKVIFSLQQEGEKSSLQTVEKNNEV